MTADFAGGSFGSIGSGNQMPETTPLKTPDGVSDRAAIVTPETNVLQEWLALLKPRIWVIAGFVLGGAAIALIYVALARPMYVATAQVLIEPGSKEASWQAKSPADYALDNAQVESQVRIIESDRVAESVVTALKLTSDPEFAGKGSNSERLAHAKARLLAGRGARRIGQSYVIEVSFGSGDPEKASTITNAIVAAYFRDQQDAKAEVAAEASKWMEGRIVELGRKLNNAVAAAQQYRIAHGITPSAGGTSPLIDELTELEATAEAYKRVYGTLVERLTESTEDASYPVPNARVITQASRPTVVAYPKTKLIIAFGMIVGLIVGLATVLVRSIVDEPIITKNQVRRITHLPCLGLLPAYRAAAPNSGAYRVQPAESFLAPFREAVRHLQISIYNRRCHNSAPCCLGLVSATPDAGNSTIALNLATTFAAANSKTLLIDADLRRRRDPPSVSAPPTASLVKALAGDDRAVPYFDAQKGIYFLAAGLEDGSNYALDPSALRHLLNTLRKEFTTIVVDLPPVTADADARVVAPLLDGCILIAEYDRCPASALEQTVEMLRDDHASMLGVVINRIPTGMPLLWGYGWQDVIEFEYRRFFRDLTETVSRRWAR